MTIATKTCIRNVLFLTDFSDESAHATGYVRGIQHHYDAKIYLTHVVDLFPFSLGSGPDAAGKVEEKFQAGKLRIDEFARAQELTGPQFEATLISGEIFSAVNQFIVEHSIDLIVVGSRGDVGMSRLFEGSTSEEIFRTARCPVMVIGPNAGPIGDHGLVRHLLFASDLSSISRVAIPFVEFLLNEGSKITVSLAHFLEHDSSSPYKRHKSRRQVEEELRKMIAPCFHNQIGEIVVESCSPAEGMIDVVRGLGADLLVLGVRYGGSFLRAETHALCSMTPRILSLAPCPLLTVRGGKNS